MLVLLLAACWTTRASAVFRPFRLNNTEAFYTASFLRPEWRHRDRALENSSVRERVLQAVVAAERMGFAWNAAGCAFPAKWSYASEISSLIANYSLFTGSSAEQRGAESFLLQLDHRQHLRPRRPRSCTSGVRRLGLLSSLSCNGDPGMPIAFANATISAETGRQTKRSHLLFRARRIAAVVRACSSSVIGNEAGIVSGIPSKIGSTSSSTAARTSSASCANAVALKSAWLAMLMS